MAQEEKNSSKAKREKVRLISILEIEKAYLELMKAYSSVLAILRGSKLEDVASLFNLKNKRAAFFHYIVIPVYIRGIFGSTIAKWRIKKSLDLLLENLVLLMTQTRNKDDIEVIKRFESYYEDINKLEHVFKKSDLKPLFYVAITTLPFLFLGVLEFLSDYLTVIDLKIIIILSILVLSNIFLWFSLFYVLGYLGSWILFSKGKVSEKEDKLFTLIKEYIKS